MSLGTGLFEKKISSSDGKDWGTLSWIQPVLSMTMDGVADLNNLVAGQVSLGKYLYLQTPLTENLAAMDNTDPKILDQIQAIGKQLVIDNKVALDEIIKMLKAR